MGDVYGEMSGTMQSQVPKGLQQESRKADEMLEFLSQSTDDSYCYVEISRVLQC